MASQRPPRGASQAPAATAPRGGKGPGGKGPGGKGPGGKAAAGQAAAGKTPAGQGAGGHQVARPPAGLPGPPGWLQLTTLALSLIGLGLSIYLTTVELQPAALLCSSHGIVNCGNVLHSAEGKIFGIAVAYFGLAFYVFMTAINTPWGWRRKEPAVRWLRLGSVVVGMCFVLYLVYAELIEIGNICLYCTGVHVVTFLLFALIVFDTTFRQTSPAGPATGRAPRR